MFTFQDTFYEVSIQLKNTGVYELLSYTQNSVHKGTIYVERAVVNSPEFIPLDNNLNADIKQAHDKYCVVSYHCEIYRQT